jgi:hypothetical protein
LNFGHPTPRYIRFTSFEVCEFYKSIYYSFQFLIFPIFSTAFQPVVMLTDCFETLTKEQKQYLQQVKGAKQKVTSGVVKPVAKNQRRSIYIFEIFNFL